MDGFKQFMKDLWLMMLDYWWLTMIIGSFILTPGWIIVFGICKLVHVSKERHKYDD
jgi:hypothetical protein